MTRSKDILAAGSATLAALRRDIRALPPGTTVNAAAALFQQPETDGLLCLPIAENGIALGTISRHQLTQIFLHRFGRELYGQRPVTAVMNPHPLMLPETLPVEAAAQQVAASIGSPISEDFVITTGDGRYAGLGVVVDLLGLVQTRLVAALRQLQSSQTALVQNEKMAALGQMVAGVAHEINTPLGYVRNNVELVRDVFAQMKAMIEDSTALADRLIDEHTDEAMLTAQLAKVHAAAGELRESRLIDDTEGLFEDTLFGVDSIRDLVVNLRNFTRLDSAKVTEVDVNECLDQTLVIAGSLLKDRVRVIKRYGIVPRVLASPAQLNQVLLNLIGNAAQAIDHADGVLLLKTGVEAGWLTISVQDNGRGIAAEHLPKIFEPFFTTKPAGQGTGLGLSISRQIVQAHGGDIRVASVLGRGTRFVVRLPRVSATDRPATEAAARAPSP